MSMSICKIVSSFRDFGIPNGKDEVVGVWHEREAYSEVFCWERERFCSEMVAMESLRC